MWPAEDHNDVEGTGASVMWKSGEGEIRSTGRVNLEKNGLREIIKIYIILGEPDSFP